WHCLGEWRYPLYCHAGQWVRSASGGQSHGFRLTAEQHYEQYGYQEGLAPNAFFNPAEYIRAKATAMFNDANNSYLTIDAAAQDFVNIWGGNVYNHYLQFGEAEGVNPSNSFDVSGYYEAKLAQLQAAGNTEITTVAQVKAAFEAAGLTALEHFISFGQTEGITAPAVPAGEQVNVDTSVPGETFTLTTGLDTLTGTSKDDSFVSVVDAQTAANSTLTAADSVNGGDGNDTLKITTQGTAAIADATNGASISNVETVELRAVGTGGVALAGTSLPGVTTINNRLSTDAVTLTSLADTTSVKVTGNGVATNGATTATYAAAATSGELTVDGGVTAGAIAVNGAGLTSLDITSSGAANTTGAISTTGTPTSVSIAAATALTTTGLTVGTNAAAQSLSVSGAGKVTLGTLDDDFATVNASANTGGVVATLNTLVTGKTTGSSAADTFTTAAVLTTGSVDAGAGTDTLVVADSTHLASATLGGKYTNFETLQLNDGVAVDLDNIAGITSVVINDGAGTTAATDLSAAQAGAVTIKAGNGAATIGVKGAATVGQIDTVKMTFDDGDATLNEDINAASSTFTLASIENLEVTAVDQVDITQSNAASGDLASVKLMGAGNISFVTGDMDQVNFSLDASGSTGTNTLNAGAFATNGVSIKGGAGVDTITGSAQADVIEGGAGNDMITGGAGADTLTGGAGADTFSFAVTDSGVTAGTIDVITDFVAGTDKLQFTGIVDVVSGQQAAVQTAVSALAAGSDATAIANAMANANTTDNGVSFAVFEGNTYAFIEGGVDATGTTAAAADDALIQLSGVTTLPTFAADVVA
ncbi:hemolysin type calcium-binding protein, partial [Halomonas alkaliantarctica]